MVRLDREAEALIAVDATERVLKVVQWPRSIFAQFVQGAVA
jgi:hypothetical protein